MKSPQHRLPIVLTLATLVGLSAWKFLPGTSLDRLAFETVARGFANPPFTIAGKGSPASPWTLRMIAPEKKSRTKTAPTIVALQDDPKGFFQASPPAPVDYAVIFSNFLRLGKSRAACAAVLSWEAPDPIGLGALEKVLARFDHLIMAAPLTRGAVSAVMPPPFRRASFAESAVRGDLTHLPRVNRMPIPGQVLGGENALAGFSSLESEAPGKSPYLLARWEDRVVLSFHLLTLLERHNTPSNQLEIHIGDSIRLGPDGTVIPIDRYGRLTQAISLQAATPIISAESLVLGDSQTFPKDAREPVILRDDRSATEPATRAFSENLAATLTTLANHPKLSAPQTFARLPGPAEIAIMWLVVAATGFLSTTSNDLRHLGGIVIGGVLLAAQWLTLGLFSIWLPGLPLLLILLSALAISYQPQQKLSVCTPPEPPPAPTPQKTPAKKAAPTKRKTRKR